MSYMQWVQDHWQLIIGTLVVLANELIAWSPKFKSNSIIQFILGLKPGSAPKELS